MIQLFPSVEKQTPTFFIGSIYAIREGSSQKNKLFDFLKIIFILTTRTISVPSSLDEAFSRLLDPGSSQDELQENTAMNY